MERVARILERMSGVSHPQKKFLVILFTTLLLLRGKAKFRNLSRDSSLCEKTFSRQYRKPFDFTGFTRLALEEAIPSEHEQIAAMDASYLPKSGRETYGIDRFFDSTHNRPARGLEISTVSVIDVTQGTGYALSTRQTPPGEALRARSSSEESLDATSPPPRSSGKKTVSEQKEESRIDFYVEHLREVRPSLPEEIRYVVTDGGYTRRTFVEGVIACGLHQVGKLRADANLRYLYKGPQKPRGARRKYDGKVNLQDLSRLDYVGEVEEKIHLYTAVVNSIRLQRNLRIAYLLNLRDEKHPRYALLFSTDPQLEALTLYAYYKARFQIEFLFRDAKQFTGLCDCQARCPESLHFHVNASLTAVNLAKWEAGSLLGQEASDPFSMASMKAVCFNEHLMGRIISMLGVDPTSIKSHPAYEQLRTYGAIRA
jgi:hypothetical protein